MHGGLICTLYLVEKGIPRFRSARIQYITIGVIECVGTRFLYRSLRQNGQLTAHRWERRRSKKFLQLNAQLTSDIGGTIFIIGFLLSGILADKETERIPAEIRTAMEAMVASVALKKNLMVSMWLSPI